MEEGLNLANSATITGRHDSKYSQHKFKIIDEPKEQPNMKCLGENVAFKIIKGRQTVAACSLREWLGFKSHDAINTKEQAVLRSIKDAFEGKNMQTQEAS